jgi:creatine kinase
VKGEEPAGSVWEVSNVDRLGASTVDAINSVLEGGRMLCALEERLEFGEPICGDLPGLGDESFPGFPSGKAPMTLPDLSQHRSVAASLLWKNPGVYGELRQRKTSAGVQLGDCIKAGLDCPEWSGPGILAGDPECYGVFSEIFGPVVEVLVDGQRLPRQHPHDLDVSKISRAALDPGKAVCRSVCVRVRRNLSGMRMPSTCSREERLVAEQALVKAIESLGADGLASYQPLATRTVDEGAPRDAGMLFREPRTQPQLAAGLGRHWPEGRGVFAARGLACCVNEEDHLSVVCRQEGADMAAVVGQALGFVRQVDTALAESAMAFSRDEKLGYLTVSPANLGPGVSCSAVLELAMPGAQVQQACKSCGLRAARLDQEAPGSASQLGVSSQGPLWEVSTPCTLGMSAVDVATFAIEGLAQLTTSDMEYRAQEKVHTADKLERLPSRGKDRNTERPQFKQSSTITW